MQLRVPILNPMFYHAMCVKMWAYQVLENLNSFGGKLDWTILQAMLASFDHMVEHSEIKLNPVVETQKNYSTYL